MYPSLGQQVCQVLRNEVFVMVKASYTSVSCSSAHSLSTTATPFDGFSSEQELAELAAQWPADRLVAIWNRRAIPASLAVRLTAYPQPQPRSTASAASRNWPNWPPSGRPTGW